MWWLQVDKSYTTAICNENFTIVQWRNIKKIILFYFTALFRDIKSSKTMFGLNLLDTNSATFELKNRIYHIRVCMAAVPAKKFTETNLEVCSKKLHL